MMELLVVLVIIGLLAAFVGPILFERISPAKQTAARSQIEAFMTALDIYLVDNGGYPTTEQGLEALVTRPNDPGIRNWKDGGYLDRLPVDPWGNPYQYLNPGNNGEIDIYTLGRDGRPGGEGLDADIGNWDPQ